MELFRNIFFNTDKVVENTDVKVTYAGKLFQNGSDNVIVHYGFGENWENAYDVTMEKSELGYQADIHVEPNTTLNFCFRNLAGEWDNNNGSNYAFKIEKENYNTVANNAEAHNNPVYNTTAYNNNATTVNNNDTEGYNTKVYNTVPFPETKINAQAYAEETTNVTPEYAETITAETNETFTTANTITTPYTANASNENTTTGTTLCKTPTTPTWGELFKKTFNNFVNYFSKLFSSNKQEQNNK